LNRAQIFPSDSTNSFPIEHHFIPYRIVGTPRFRLKNCCLGQFCYFSRIFWIYYFYFRWFCFCFLNCFRTSGDFLKEVGFLDLFKGPVNILKRQPPYAYISENKIVNLEFTSAILFLVKVFEFSVLLLSY
jgi:hypothetical protein